MSATGRNLEGRERHEDDFYETPEWCTRAILSALYPKDVLPPVTVLDAGAGTGAILRACGAHFDDRKASYSGGGFPIFLAGVEKSEERVQRANEYEAYPDREDLRFFAEDFYKVRGWIDDEISLCDRRGNQKFSLVISNPPYSEAERFVEHALKIGTTVCFLLRLNWLASKKRAPFHRAHPSDVYVLPRRPSFTGGGTDATEYAWFVWRMTAVTERSTIQANAGNRWWLLEVEE